MRAQASQPRRRLTRLRGQVICSRGQLTRPRGQVTCPHGRGGRLRGQVICSRGQVICSRGQVICSRGQVIRWRRQVIRSRGRVTQPRAYFARLGGGFAVLSDARNGSARTFGGAFPRGLFNLQQRAGFVAAIIFAAIVLRDYNVSSYRVARHPEPGMLCGAAR
jgi:hypothetical protein